MSTSKKSTYNNANFSTYICRVLKQVHPGNGMSGDGLTLLNNLLRITINRLMIHVNRLMVSSSGRKTIGSREVQTAVRLAFPGELSKHGVDSGTKAVVKYNNSKKEREEREEGGPPQSRGSLAGLTFPVTRIENIMKELSNSERKSETAAVYMAAVIEYLTAEILELAGNVSRNWNKVRVTPRHIKLAIDNDGELSKLYSGVVMSGGVVPHVEPAVEELKKKVVKKVVKKTAKKKTT